MARKRSSKPAASSSLREKAEAALRVNPPDITKMATGEIQLLLHEFQVHQIELKIQNEELIASQSELAQSHDRFNDLYDFAPVGYFTLDEDGTIIEANLTAATMLGVVRDKLVGRKFTRFVEPGGQDTLYRHQQAAFECKDTQTSDILLRRQDGGTFFVRMETVCHRDSVSRRAECRSAIIDVTARKQAEDRLAELNEELELRVAERTESLRASEELLRQVTGAIDQVFWMTDVEKEVLLYISPAYERIWGRTCKSLYDVARSWVDAIHPEDRPRVTAAALKQGNVEYDHKYRITRPDGTERWIHDRAFPVRDATGKMVRIAGIAEDITEQKRTEDALAENEHRLSGIIEAAMDAIISVDAGQRVIMFNAAAEKMFQWPAEEALGRPLNTFIPARLHAGHDADVRKFDEAGTTSRMMGRLLPVTGLRKDGTEFPVEASISQIKSDGHKIFTAILRDVSSRERKDAVLRRQAHLLHLSHDAIIVWDTKDGISFWNEGAARLYGHAEEASLGQWPQKHIQSIFPRPWLEIESELRERGFWEGTIRQTARDGTPLTVSSRMQKIGEEDGRGMVILESNRDITDRLALEEALLRVSEAERQRIGRDLHDGLGQELAGISMMNSVLQDNLTRKALPEAEAAARLGKLLNHALNEVRRISHGLQPLPPDPQSLMTSIGKFLEDIGTGSPARFIFDCPGIVRVHNHESANHLYRIAQEAVNNALRHGKPRNVTVRLSRDDGRVILQVQDDGIGFDPENTKSGTDGIGLDSMRYRSEAMGAVLEISRPSADGTLVRCSVPDPVPADTGGSSAA